jgi:hypothetical protein
MISFEIDLRQEPFKSALKKAPSELESIVSQEIANWAIRTSNLAKSRSPVRTGNLRQSILPAKTTDSANVSALAMYAKFVEPPPLGVPMKRKMTRTQFLYNSAIEELDVTVLKINDRIKELFEV